MISDCLVIRRLDIGEWERLQRFAFVARFYDVQMDPRIEALITLMKTDLRRMLPISRMAQAVNLSPTRLSCLFKAETGSPPARYLRQMRMQLAATLLVETFLSVKEIMARVGINDESHFVRDFKRITGMTPMQYRKQNRRRDKKAIAAKH